MAKDILKTISKLQKVYGYYGDIKGAYDKIKTVEKASKIKPTDIAGMKALFGLGSHDADIKKLIKILDDQTKLTLEAAKGTFDPIKTNKDDAWAKWATQIVKYGDVSRQAQDARKKYLEALIKYDKALKERTTYCDILIKYSTKAVKLYKDLEKYAKYVMGLTEKLVKMPEVIGSAHQVEALDMHLAFNGLAPAASRLHKAHTKLIAVAKAEKTAKLKIKSANEVWIKDLQKANLTKLLKDALSYMGVDVAA